MIYLASNYSHDDPAIREARFVAVCQYAAKMMGDGLHVFSPIAMSHPIACHGELPKDWAYWEASDRWFIERCDAVWVLMLDGWADSVGIRAELKIAQELGKPVKYCTPE